MLRELISLVSLPSDVKTFWQTVKPFIPALLAAGLLSGAVAFFRSAPLWQIALLGVTIFAGCSLIVFLWLHFSPVVKSVLRRKGVLDSPKGDSGTDARPSTATYIENVHIGDQVPPEPAPDEGQRLIKKWRAEIQHGNFKRTPHGASKFCNTETYVEMEPYLLDDVRRRFKSHVGAALTFVGPEHLRGSEGDKLVLLGEVARIEKEWVLSTREPITTQADPSELKPLCLHLAEELEWGDTLYKDREQAIQIWIPELQAQGLSESEIEEKVASAQEDNVIQTLKRYNKHLKDRLLELHDALGPRGWLGPLDRSRIENLYDPYDMRRLAKRLREVCGKLPGG